MQQHRTLPDINRVSVLVAVILLAYALVRVISLPEYQLQTQLGSRTLTLDVDFGILVAFIIAGLTATGTDWLLRSHPAFQGSAVEHWLLPTLTAWALSIPLSSLPGGPAWWAAFATGGLLIALVLLAEFVAIDPQDARFGLATAGLTALSFALFLILTAALRFTGARLFLQLPVVVVSAALVSLRTLHLRMGGSWQYGWMIGIALMTTQLATAWHYLPVTPVQYGLLMLGPVYALTGLAVNHRDGVPLRRALGELAATVAVFWALAFFLR